LPIGINNTAAAGSPDDLTIGVGSEIGTFVGSDGKTYGLMVTGFGCGCGDDGVTTYGATASANEGQVVCLPIHGQFAEKAPPPGAGTPPTIPDTDVHVPSVPEPATLVMAAVGLVTVGVRRWR
jgi:hypothetical protein